MAHYLIVGQGVAGISVAYQLLLRGHKIDVIDRPDAHRATSVAAGIINPITGKRFVLSWRYFDFFPVAQAFYRDLEGYLGQQLWYDRTIVRVLEQQADVNSWASRSGFAEMQAIMSQSADGLSWQGYLSTNVQYGLLHGAAQVRLPHLHTAWRERGLAEGWYREAAFDYTDLPSLSAQYDGIVLCTGHHASTSGPFQHLPWNHAKGTAAYVRLQSQTDVPLPSDLLKRTIMLAPALHELGLYWAGANYEWQQTDARPTDIGIDLIATELRAMCGDGACIEEVISGIRPVLRDRRPVVLKSDQYQNVFIFNGLGAKGALLAPYWSRHLVEVVMEA
jgi:glycine oxidase